MGFVPTKKLYNLEFKNEDLEGLKVKVWGLDVGKFMSIMDLANLAEGEGGEAGSVEDIKKLFATLAEIVQEWNIETEAGDPIPCTLDGVKTLEFDLAFTILMQAFEAITGVTSPLGQPSNDGEQLEELQIPMAAS